MAGRIAEELCFGDNFTSGASNDFKVATSIAKAMVTEWGMSKLPLLSYSSNDQEIFLGREVTKHQNLSNETIAKIDKEIERIVIENYNKAKKYLTDNYNKLLTMAQVLMELETINSDVINKIYEGKTTVDILGNETTAIKWTPEYSSSDKKNKYEL